MEIQKLIAKFENFMELNYESVSLETKFPCSLSFIADYKAHEHTTEYKDPGAQLMWVMFVAGADTERKNLSVSLPKTKERPEGYYDAGYNEGINDCKRSLISSGIKIKK
ncbi:hypothetical protein [Yersinia enterocolitica]|uniref:Phage protein n=1 Tax=Yersinia enterocolitica TaxID=630 RepID=A0ABM9SFW4_YEREN|nr:hypothetical protein [Yersinia enterocolitica]CNE50619.1 Uncharacterised protein [Yersinia enterocolitica]